MVVRATYSLDEATVRRLRRTSERLGKPQSQIVREAIADYASRCDRLSEVERLHMLKVLGRLRSEQVTGSAEAVEAELREIRESRRVGWDRESDRR